MGQTLRPGGFDLTEKGVKYCNITGADKVLDLGCGMGATIGYLYEKHQIAATGIDPSEKLLSIAKERCNSSDFAIGTGENIPFDEGSFNCVFAECTLSLMDNQSKVLQEVSRVLKKNGWFIITDVYAKNADLIETLESHLINSCMRGLHNLNFLEDSLKDLGFEIMYLEDCSNYLKELMVKIIFSYGSMNVFWNKTTDQDDSCMNGLKFQESLKACKPGYFMLIAKKGEL